MVEVARAVIVNQNHIVLTIIQRKIRGGETGRDLIAALEQDSVIAGDHLVTHILAGHGKLRLGLTVGGRQSRNRDKGKNQQQRQDEQVAPEMVHMSAEHQNAYRSSSSLGCKKTVPDSCTTQTSLRMAPTL
jgi:hypothetical protein